MENILKILNELHNNKIGFCFQSRTNENYYNLKVYTPQGDEKYINHTDIKKVEEDLIIIWGHLIGCTTNVIKPSARAGVPIPPPMPSPT